MHRICYLLFAPLLFASPAHAWEFRCRFVERIGTTDTPLPGNFLDATSDAPRRVRIQCGVFDTAESEAPHVGFVGWNVGTISVGGLEGSSDERRAPGRLSPFNFANQPNSNGNPPLPSGDPFTTLTEIDATLGTQSPVWMCGPDGQ